MDTRYHIEEMVSQDEKGVVFQGTDTVTGVIVAIRRFIASGGRNSIVGDAGRQAYADAITKLRKVPHASLRRILAGGCDPVDEMPYLVTRWVDGTPLGELMGKDEALDPGLVCQILDQFLDANAAIIEFLGRDGLWLEATPESMVLKSTRDEQGNPVAVFWLCPWQWLQSDKAGSEIIPLANLAEAMLGGPRKIATNNPSSEFVKWIKDIRAKNIATIKDARESLQALNSCEKPPQKDTARVQEAVKQKAMLGEIDSPGEFDLSGLKIARTPLPVIASQAIFPRLPQNKHSIKPAKIAIVCALIVVIAFFSWLIASRDQGGPSPAAEAPNSQARQPSQAKVDEMLTQIHRNNGAAEERRQHIERRGYYTIDDTDLLLGLAGQEVTLRGRLARVHLSDSDRTMYLEFSEAAQNDQARAYALTQNLTDGIPSDDLDLLVGKLIEIRGPVDIETHGEIQRPRVELLHRIRIKVLEAAEDYELR